MNKLLTLAGGLSALALTAPASAVLLTYTITGTDHFATFTLDSNPDIGFFYSTDEGFSIYDVDGTFTRGDYTTYVNDINFYNSSKLGGISTFDNDIFQFIVLADGPQLYTGTESSPTLLTGSFVIMDYLTHTPATLTVTAADTPGAVPEPASWAMLLTGFGLAGGALRARRTKLSFA